MPTSTTDLRQPSIADEYVVAMSEQVLSTPYRVDYLRADAEFEREAATARAERHQPRVWPPPPGPSALQRSTMAAHKRDRIMVAAARWLQRRTRGSAMLGLIVVPAGATRFGMTVACVEPTQIVRRSRQRSSHRAVARPAAKATADPDGPAEPPTRGAVEIIVERRPIDSSRRAELVGLLAELVGGAR